jgi:hypothetical protein
MKKRRNKKSLYDAYKFPGFTYSRVVKGVFGDRQSLVLSLNRRSKRQCAGHVAPIIEDGTTSDSDILGISFVETVECTWKSGYAESGDASVMP